MFYIIDFRKLKGLSFDLVKFGIQKILEQKGYIFTSDKIFVKKLSNFNIRPNSNMIEHWSDNYLDFPLINLKSYPREVFDAATQADEFIKKLTEL